jgi:hypothetical protein
MSLRNRIVGWLLKAAGLGATITGLFGAVDERFLFAAVLIIAGLGLVVLGTLVSPSPGTGAFTARYMMETNNELHMVKAPKGNVLDPADNERFRGR